MEVTVEEAVVGARKRLVLGAGKTVDLTVPASVADGAILRLKGQGEPGAAGSGDLLVEVAIASHPIFSRRDNDLIMDLSVSVPDAVLGGRLSAPTPEGEVALRIPSDSNSGAVLRLKGRGLAGPDGRRGDLLARLVVTLPGTTDPELKRFCEDWRRDRPYHAPEPSRLPP